MATTPQTLLSPLQLVTPVLPPSTTTMSVDSTVLPVTVLADAKTTRIELSLYNTTTPITTYTASSNGNIFTTSVAIDQTVLETAVQLIGRNYDPNAAWNPLTTYAASYRYADEWCSEHPRRKDDGEVIEAPTSLYLDT